MTLRPLNCNLLSLVKEHRRWLSQFDGRYLQRWDKDFQRNDEAALAEAEVRRRFEAEGLALTPSDTVSGSEKGLDFRCDHPDGTFFVEATCIEKRTATNRTGIPEEPGGAYHFRPINLAVFNKVKEKAAQCGVAEAPSIVAIGTWHATVARELADKLMMGLLITGEPKITWSLNSQTGVVGDADLVTNLYPALYQKLDEDGRVVGMRRTVSGTMLVPFGYPYLAPLMVANPYAKHLLKNSLLPTIEFGQGKIDDEGKIRVEWSKP